MNVSTLSTIQINVRKRSQGKRKDALYEWELNANGTNRTLTEGKSNPCAVQRKLRFFLN